MIIVWILAAFALHILIQPLLSKYLVVENSRISKGKETISKLIDDAILETTNSHKWYILFNNLEFNKWIKMVNFKLGNQVVINMTRAWERARKLVTFILG